MVLVRLGVELTEDGLKRLVSHHERGQVLGVLESRLEYGASLLCYSVQIQQPSSNVEHSTVRV